MSGWARVAFDEVAQDASAGHPKVPQSDYLESGTYPVIDQGEKDIGGYTDDERLLCSEARPVILFGDHTRRLKYVEDPFCLGADGVKVIRSQPGVDPRFLFHQLLSLNLPSAGYSRHFKFLKRELFVAPPIEEQRRIAVILDKADELRAKRRAALAHLDSLTQSIFLDMFGDSGVNPAKWPVRPLIELIDPGRPLTYGILMPGPDQPDGVPYVRVTDMADGGIAHGRVRRTTPEISNAYRRSLLREGDLLLSIRGHVGRLALVPPQLDGANITQDSARLAVVGANSHYILWCLRSEGMQRWMQRHVKGVAVRGINLGDVKRLPIPVPAQDLQREFARRCRTVAETQDFTRTQADELDELFASLQQRAFSGRCD